ncbi:MAG: 4'-phosphopantetheinyl transferase superfamily protein [Atopobiaceae bacterium]|nr:4'-phosphopantetheinyl transferase superfamily protein [Atopobiaceae bacterium]
MPSLQLVHDPVVAELAEQTFAGLGCSAYGIAILQGAESWGAHERGLIELPYDEGTMRVSLAYDEREAPYPIDQEGREQHDLLLSLTDEDDYIACAWARVTPGSPLLGVGIDLNATSHFRPRKSGKDYSQLLFTTREHELVEQVAHDDPIPFKAALFAAKEAAFKSTAHPLRVWYQDHDDELLFEVRHFCMEELGAERGTARNGAAQAAMDRMGIARVVVRQAMLRDMALVTAVALAE